MNLKLDESQDYKTMNLNRTHTHVRSQTKTQKHKHTHTHAYKNNHTHTQTLVRGTPAQFSCMVCQDPTCLYGVGLPVYGSFLIAGIESS